MLDFFRNLFNTQGFPPRWHCGLWTSGHGWLHILSDIGTWTAYYAIPFVLVYVALRRKDVPFRPLFWFFGHSSWPAAPFISWTPPCSGGPLTVSWDWLNSSPPWCPGEL